MSTVSVAETVGRVPRRGGTLRMFADDHALEGFVVKDTPACQLADAVRIADGNGWL